MNTKVSIKETFWWRETQGRWLAAPSSPPRLLLSPSLSWLAPVPLAYGERALLFLLNQTLPERNFFPIVGWEAKRYLFCSRLLWDNIWFEGLFSLLWFSSRWLSRSATVFPVSPLQSTNFLAGGWRPLLQIVFRLGGDQTTPINVLLMMTLEAQTQLRFSELEGSLPLRFLLLRLLKTAVLKLRE